MEYKLRVREVHYSVYKEKKSLLDRNKNYSYKEFIIDDLIELSEYFSEQMFEIETNLMEAKHLLNLYCKNESIFMSPYD